MTSPDRTIWPGSDHPSSRRASVALLIGALAFLALRSSGTAQAPRRIAPPTPLAAATRALNEGKYDDIEALTDKLDARDPNVVALKARAGIARGKYSEAEAALKPAATRAPTSEAALELGLLYHMLGRPEAKALLERIAPMADTSNDPYEVARAGRALRALGRLHEANAAYREAAAGLPMDPAVQTAWGELFLDGHENREAMKSFQMAMQVDQRWTPALIGAARTLADDNPPQASAFVKRALEINPSSVDAQIFIAEQAMDAERKTEAREALAKALAVNPSSLDAHAMLAAMLYVEDKQQEFDAQVAKVQAIAPNYGDVFRTVGAFAARNYRFDEAVTLTRRALSVDGENPRALADLGVHLLRTGDEPGARAALDASFKADPFDRVTFNLLAMLDTLDKFVTVRDGDIVMRLHADEAPVLTDYALPLAKQALTTLAGRYEFTPKGPILIEVFPKHDDFAVRNAGLPGMIGALGACFGRVVTMDSPRARPPGEFQWEATLWHELAHVITLQMSNQRLPRWLSEGLSTYEEKLARPEWARQMDTDFAAMLNRDGAIKLRDLNAAFQNPKLISIAYYQGGLLVEHLQEVYGIAGIRKLLRAYGEGLDTDAALRSALNTSFDELQSGFDQTIEKLFGDMRRAIALPQDVEILRKPLEDLKPYANDNPRNYPVQISLGMALRKNGQLDEAMQAFERAAALIPTARGDDSPHAQMADIAIEKKDTARAITELTAVVATDFDNVKAARDLATLLRQTKVDISTPAGADRLRPVYERIAAIDPFDAEAHAALGQLAMQRNQADAAVREFRTVIALGPVDRAAAHTDLAEAYFKGGNRADAKKQTLAALEIAPTYERAQELLLKLVDGGRQ